MSLLKTCTVLSVGNLKDLHTIQHRYLKAFDSIPAVYSNEQISTHFVISLVDQPDQYSSGQLTSNYQIFRKQQTTDPEGF
jgi:hypothetical protein